MAFACSGQLDASPGCHSYCRLSVHAHHPRRDGQAAASPAVCVQLSKACSHKWKGASDWSGCPGRLVRPGQPTESPPSPISSLSPFYKRWACGLVTQEEVPPFATRAGLSTALGPVRTTICVPSVCAPVRQAVCPPTEMAWWSRTVWASAPDSGLPRSGSWDRPVGRGEVGQAGGGWAKEQPPGDPGRMKMPRGHRGEAEVSIRPPEQGSQWAGSRVAERLRPMGGNWKLPEHWELIWGETQAW